jgi:hypothetical protein
MVGCPEEDLLDRRTGRHASREHFPQMACEGDKSRTPMQIASRRKGILHRQISHAALWLLICLGGGTITILVLYLATGSRFFDKGLISLCIEQVR